MAMEMAERKLQILVNLSKGMKTEQFGPYHTYRWVGEDTPQLPQEYVRSLARGELITAKDGVLSLTKSGKDYLLNRNLLA